MSTTAVPTLIDQLGEAALAAREATIEARQAAKDLRAATREAREAEASLRKVQSAGAHEAAETAVAVVLTEEVPKLVTFLTRSVEGRVDRRVARELDGINVALDKIARESGAPIRPLLVMVPPEDRAS